MVIVVVVFVVVVVPLVVMLVLMVVEKTPPEQYVKVQRYPQEEKHKKCNGGNQSHGGRENISFAMSKKRGY